MWESYRKKTLNRRDIMQWMTANLIAAVECMPFRLFGGKIPKTANGKRLDDPEAHLIEMMSKEDFDKKRKKDLRRRRKIDRETSKSRWQTAMGGPPPETGPVLGSFEDLLKKVKGEQGHSPAAPIPSPGRAKVINLESLLAKGREEMAKREQSPETAPSFVPPVPAGVLPAPTPNIKKTGRKSGVQAYVRQKPI